MKANSGTDWMLVSEAAARTGIDPSTIRQMCRNGRIKGAFLAGVWRIPRAFEVVTPAPPARDDDSDELTPSARAALARFGTY